MIRSYRGDDTEKFAGGESVRRFRAFERVAYRKIKYLMAAKTLDDLRVPPGNKLSPCGAIARGNIPSVSTTNGGFASCGATGERRTLKSWIITEEDKDEDKTSASW